MARGLDTKRLGEKIREFEKVGDTVAEAMKQRAEGDRQLRTWQRERSRAEKEVEEAFKTAREQEEARRKAKK